MAGWHAIVFGKWTQPCSEAPGPIKLGASILIVVFSLTCLGGNLMELEFPNHACKPAPEGCVRSSLEEDLPFITSHDLQNLTKGTIAPGCPRLHTFATMCRGMLSHFHLGDGARTPSTRPSVTSSRPSPSKSAAPMPTSCGGWSGLCVASFDVCLRGVLWPGSPPGPCPPLSAFWVLCSGASSCCGSAVRGAWTSIVPLCSASSRQVPGSRSGQWGG